MISVRDQVRGSKRELILVVKWKEPMSFAELVAAAFLCTSTDGAQQLWSNPALVFSGFVTAAAPQATGDAHEWEYEETENAGNWKPFSPEAKKAAEESHSAKRTHVSRDSYALTRARTHTHKYTPTHAHTHYTHTHICIHTHTHTHKRTHPLC